MNTNVERGEHRRLHHGLGDGAEVGNAEEHVV